MLTEVDTMLEPERIDQSLCPLRCQMSMRQSNRTLLHIELHRGSLSSGRRHRLVLGTLLLGWEAKHLTAFSKVWARVCHRPHNNNYARMRAAAIGSGVAAFFMVACRIVARIYTASRFWWDDWFHITAGVG